MVDGDAFTCLGRFDDDLQISGQQQTGHPYFAQASQSSMQKKPS